MVEASIMRSRKTARSPKFQVSPTVFRGFLERQESDDKAARERILSKKHGKNLIELQTNLKTLRKSLLLHEVCTDIAELQSCLLRLMRFDSLHSCSRADNEDLLLELSAGAGRPEGAQKILSYNDREVAAKRQESRYEFQSMLKRLESKYLQRSHAYGKSVERGANVDMLRDPKDYAAEAVGLIVKVSCMALKHG